MKRASTLMLMNSIYHFLLSTISFSLLILGESQPGPIRKLRLGAYKNGVSTVPPYCSGTERPLALCSIAAGCIVYSVGGFVGEQLHYCVKRTAI